MNTYIIQKEGKKMKFCKYDLQRLYTYCWENYDDRSVPYGVILIRTCSYILREIAKFFKIVRFKKK
jgi:hypothetical protein